MLIAIVAHHSRRDMANDLASKLEADSIFMDEHSAGANANHLRALSWVAEQSDRVIIIEEDALPVDGFRDKAQDWLARFPCHMLSFYLGTGRPPQYQMQIAERLIVADKTRADYITLSRLIHGVCYSVPPEHVQRVLSRWDNSKPADYAVGDAWGGSVIYPCYSLVDHADLPTVERHPDNEPRTERRRAWRLA
ncbi:TPA: hypothetical protein LR347_003710 [Enterobacter hormaechei]|uniref:hypothetical protein n=1 Tax=Enterobacter asburiae TaxID=61645 RepID=UPI0020069FB7|nr:hypothetical protein [Enterobacter asburiae]MCK6835571.1 hypothetical protein [Enterobacter asburiae]HBL5392641.1 hypothetical protein [Enterobacter hormaechei]HEO9919075.1 hypothetical protein [Enterobacter asburiae]